MSRISTAAANKHSKLKIMNKCIDLIEIINLTDCLKFIILT